MHTPDVMVCLFSGSDEELTGADVEWWVGDGLNYVRLLVQAKRLNREAKYAEAGRDIGQTGVRQVDRLIEICEIGLPERPRGMNYVGLTPVYLFYNGAVPALGSTADLCRNSKVGEPRRGCTIAHARAVRAALGPAGRPRRRALTHGQIAASTLPWSCLFCCPARHGGPAERAAQSLAESAGGRSRGQSSDRPRDDEAPVQLWRREALPIDPLQIPADPMSILEVAPDGWAPGGRLLAVTTIPPGDD